jgi:hypothetical protein
MTIEEAQARVDKVMPGNTVREVTGPHTVRLGDRPGVWHFGDVNLLYWEILARDFSRAVNDRLKASGSFLRGIP